MLTICVGIQCVVVVVLLHLFVLGRTRRVFKLSLIGMWWILSLVMLIFAAGVMVQVALWAGLFTALGEFDDFTTAYYHSLVNFATLGYGDLVMSPGRRLLGAIEAVNGALMLGLTASSMYAVLSELIRRFAVASRSRG
ncbi:MAG TPA: ion channel [Blastocatellia bacterium]|nr:ion channel [Blastocatellia bacterium]